MRSRSELEDRLTQMWREKLGVEAVGRDDNFFELGGTSLLAADLLMDIYLEFDCEVDPWVLFLQPTITELATSMLEAQPAGS